MTDLPRGYTAHPDAVVQHDDGTCSMTFVVTIAWWRKVWELAKALTHARVSRVGSTWVVSL